MIPTEQKISRLLDADTPQQVFDCLTVWLTQLSGDISPGIFLLSTQNPGFVQVEKSGVNGITRPLNFIFDENRHIKSLRNNSIIGFVELSSGANDISGENKLVISATLKRLYRRIYLGNFFKHIKRHVDFTNKDTYYDETANLLADALSMEMVAIRQLTPNGDLECIAFFHESKNNLSVNFSKEQMPLPFADALAKAHSAIQSEQSENLLEPSFEVVKDINSERFAFLTLASCLTTIKAFAIFPIVIEDTLFGVISCCTSSPLEFSELEQMAISTTMQIVSVSISNFHSYHEARLLEATRTDQLFDMSALEIAQGTRHELANIQTEQALKCLELKNYLSDKNKEAWKILGQLYELTDNMSNTINKLKSLTANGGTPELQHNTSIKAIWESAVDFVKNRIDSMKVKVYYQGGNITDSFYSDWLRSAFLNLLFNSLDAFASRPKSNRIIRLVVQKENDSAQDYVLDYSDTAGGIVFNKLRIPESIREANQNMDKTQLLFQPKVSSKKGGTGWGLFLVRRAINMHKGSINLRDNTNEGCSFRITLRKGLTDTTKT